MTALLSNLVDFIGAHPVVAVVVVFLVSAGEAVFVVGLFVPSTVVLVGAGTLIGMGQLSFWPSFIAASLGATVGDGLSFWIGHIHKDRLKRIWPFARYRALIDHGERFFLRHGGKSIFIGRFLPGVKSVVPVIAGMMGMSVARFATINGVSALAWSAAHIVPSIALGRGISVFGSGNPRLVALVLIVLMLGLAAWYLLKLSIVWLGPRVSRLHRVSVESLESTQSSPLHLARRVLINDGGIVVAMAWSVAALLAAFGFGALLLNLLFEPELIAADHAISNFLQSLRNGPGDAAMVAITMVGDSVVLTALAVALVAMLAAYRQWRVGAVVFIAVLSATVFVPLIKSALHRARPADLYAGAEAFSFPSGHATLSMTIFGLIAVILADGRSARARLAIYASAVGLAGAIAISRVYLRAHWPSDVAAGLLFGAAIVSVIGFLLHRYAPRIPTMKFAIGLGLVFLLAYPIDLARSYASWSIAYAPKEQSKFVSSADWLQSDWRSLPAQRIQLDGETGEHFIVQTDIPPAQLLAILEAAGWRAFPLPTLVEEIAVLVPSRTPFSDQLPLPSLHDGRAAIVVLARQSPTDIHKRLVLRFWTSGTVAGSSPTSPAPILLGSITAEVEDPFLFGLTGIEPSDLTIGERTTLGHQLEATLGAQSAVSVSRLGQEPFLASLR